MWKVILIVAVLACQSCTIYRVKAEHENGLVTKVFIISGRNFVAPDLKYSREGQVVGFEFKAESSQQPSPVDYATGVSDVLNVLRGGQPGLAQPIILPAPVVITPATPAPTIISEDSISDEP